MFKVMLKLQITDCIHATNSDTHFYTNKSTWYLLGIELEHRLPFLNPYLRSKI